MRFKALAVSGLVWLATIAAAPAAERVALLFGNADYDNVSALANPVNDATDLATSLQRIGFETTLVVDADFSAMHKALQTFSLEAQGAKVALVYFAGHGIEIDKQNYLIPTDARLASDRQVRLETVPLDLMDEAVSGARELRLVLIDACRNNPFLSQMTMSNAGRSLGRGLTAFEPVGGSLVAFAAKGGTVAQDGSGRNSPFMEGLLKHIEQPGLDINLMFRKVRDSVLQATNDQQEPFTYGSLPGEEIYLVPPIKVAALPGAGDDLVPKIEVPAQVITVPATPTGMDEENAWLFVKNTTDPAALQEFIKMYPQGKHVGEAFERLGSLTSGKPQVEDEVETPIETASLPAVEDDLPTMSERDLVMAVQAELDRAGCRPGGVDGQWGRNSRNALNAFARDANIVLPGTGPSLDVLKALRAKPGIICVIVEQPRTATRDVTKQQAEEVEEEPVPVRKKRREQPEVNIGIGIGFGNGGGGGGTPCVGFAVKGFGISTC